ncbi:methyl-accepting chemotaxis protein [Vibrio viridaestus]|uniref:Methyl-accepting chemotaxis protein n=1 Tax=Vibrio viridaestus TaxID=2487322 RepID=A0A3N9U5E4_9VIBR|nr:methyl-accepting chemotaxis protein [Vibrio viridaestus]RQW63266.1 methyl-accepting chemotaxis protein [Vibrio viridaestus]
MFVKNLSQKQKLTAFTVLLCIGFIVMATFIASKLSDMTKQYEQSGTISQGAGTLFETQAKLLQIGSEADKLKSTNVSNFEAMIKNVRTEVKEDVEFLNQFGFTKEGQDFEQAMDDYNKALTPWLKMKAELGFTKDEGVTGQIQTNIAAIENKIQETGMVTVVSEFQAMVKSQQKYLEAQTEQNEKLLKRAKLQFINISKTYAMLNLYEKDLDALEKAFSRSVELTNQLKDTTSQVESAQNRVLKSIELASGKLISMSDQYQTQASNDASETQLSVLIACFILAVVTVLIFVMISISLTKSLKQTKTVLDKLSSGDLSQRLPVSDNKNDEFNQLALAINDTCEHLGKLVRRVQSSSEELSGDSASLNNGLDQLVEAQSNVLHQTEILASATEEVSVTAQEVSNSLEFVSDVSRQSTTAAENGGIVIESAIKSLEEVGSILQRATSHTQQLEEASAKVDSVMEIINSIAEQTNLLALNAAIEAARAGEQGRGFAVVADEVRSLAVRTVDAVTDITHTIETMKRESGEVIQYIEQSEGTVKIGQEKGLEARQALGEITEKAKEATYQTEVIVSSIKELAQTSHSMADNMSEISTLMKDLESNNEALRKTSQVVDERSTGLSRDCQKFTI